MMTKEERCRLALGYHRQHYNCGQSVLGAFRDLTGLTEEQCWGLGSGLGSGILRAFLQVLFLKEGF